MMLGFANYVKRLFADGRGNVTILFALAMIPIFAMLGFAIDYGVALSNQAKLNAAADAAAVSAVTIAKQALQGGSNIATAISAAKNAALATFNSNSGSVGFAAVPTPSITVGTDPNNPQKLNATVAYQGPTRSNFIRIIGIKQINISGTATSTLTMPTYINYYFIVDTSQSMGIGSTAPEMQNLFDRVANTKSFSGGEPGCVFGCHVPAPSTSNGAGVAAAACLPPSSQQCFSNENLAHNPIFGPPIKLRIDAAASAIQTVVQQAIASQGSNSTIRIGLYTMGDPPANSTSTNESGVAITTLAALQDSPFPDVMAAAQCTTSPCLDLGFNNAAGIGDTNFAASLEQFSQSISYQGNGSSKDQALNYIFLITDGVQDTAGSGCLYNHCVQAIDPSICNYYLKSKGTVGVLYTTYNVIYNGNNPALGLEANYKTFVSPIAANIVPNLQACASSPTSQWFYEATDGPAITAGMTALFQPTTQLARISQ